MSETKKELDVILEKCDDITCFIDHDKCPKCYMSIHILPKKDFKITTCKTTTCFDESHRYCPDCYCVIHIDL